MKTPKAQIQNLSKRLTRLSALGILATLAPLATSTVAQAQTQLSADDAIYARARQLSNGEVLASVVAFTGGNHIDLYASSNSGTSFSKVGSINDTEFATGLCCGTIFQLPRAVGTLPAGTILWAGSVGQDAANRRMKIKIYKSADNGRSWSYLSAVTAANTGGYWEPEFSISNDGALVMMYSDETNAAYSQRLVKTRSYNGTAWQDLGDMVSSTVQADRPGMAVVSKLASGSRIMTFELCGPAACTVFYKTSTDGWDWGDAHNVGSAIRLADGRYFAHAPTNTVMPNGAIMVVGQVLMNGDGSVAAANGSTIFKSASGSVTGPWTTITAPVFVPGAYDNYCPNYSSPLLSVSNGASVLELASRVQTSHCLMYFGRGSAN